MLNDVILLAKGETRVLCTWDAEEVWGVNDIGSDPLWATQWAESPQNKRLNELVKIKSSVVSGVPMDEIDKEMTALGELQKNFRKIHKIFRFDPTDDGLLGEMKRVAPIVSWQNYADIRYPLDQIMKKFNTEYLANTISYMIAYAIYTGVKKLRLFGVDAPYGGIYDIERSGIEYWIGRANEAGMEVIPSKGSHLLRTITGKLYGNDREGKIPLYFGERLMLMNTLPIKGRYQDMDKASLVRWLVEPKTRECEIHGVQMQKQPNGIINYNCTKEFAADIWMPKESWDFIEAHLRNLESKGELPIGAATIYKKLVLLPEGGER